MYETLIGSLRMSKFVSLGYRAHAPNDWDRLIDAVEIARALEGAA